jgi:hypothetical protein
MGQDVHQIEAQNKGLQVTRNNQKSLQAEIDGLMSRLRIPAYTLEVLKNEQLDAAEGVLECEKAVDRIMTVITFNFNEQSKMLLVKERLQLLQQHANEFGVRLFVYLEMLFVQSAAMYLNDKNRASQRNALKLYAHEAFEGKLYKFKYLVGWLKDTDARKHYDLQIVNIYITLGVCNRNGKDLYERNSRFLRTGLFYLIVVKTVDVT